MDCLSRPYPRKFFKGCLLQVLLGPFFEYFVPNIRLEYEQTVFNVPQKSLSSVQYLQEVC